MQHQTHGEHTDATAQTDAKVGFSSKLSEDARAHGNFLATFRRVPDAQQAEALKLAGRLHSLNLMYRRAKEFSRSVIRRVAAEADEIERQLQGMATEVYHTNAFPNTVLTAGKNFALDSFLAGSSYTAAWYLGLISSVSYSAINAADTAASHAGWTEAGATNAPTYSGNRKTAAWSSASAGSKALSAGLVFTFTGAGTVKGGFLGTTNTVDATTGTWYSAGLFTGGDKVVASSDTLTVSYSASL